VRYTPDVVNAEKWNTGLKNSLTQKDSGPYEITLNQKNSRPKTGNRKRVSNKHIIRGIKPYTPSADTRISKQRISRRRKKRAMFFLSGLLDSLTLRDHT